MQATKMKSNTFYRLYNLTNDTSATVNGLPKGFISLVVEQKKKSEMVTELTYNFSPLMLDIL